MALPSGVARTTVTFGQYMSFVGTLQAGTIKVYASRKLLWAATGDVLLPIPEIVTPVAPSGAGQIALPSTDQDGFQDGRGNAVKDWTYTAEFSVGGQPVYSVTFPLPMIPAVIDVDSLVPVTASNGTVISYPIVRSVNGQVGDVIVTGGSGPGGVTDVDSISGAGTVGKQALRTNDAASLRVVAGLSNVNDTSDNTKPVSIAQAAAIALKADAASTSSGLAAKVNTTSINAASGVAPLDSGKRLPLANMQNNVPITVTFDTTTNTYPPRPAYQGPVFVRGPGAYVPAGGGTVAGGGGFVDGLDDWHVRG